MKDATAMKIALALLIRVGRQNKNLTRRELALRVGISPRTIASYENEVTLPTLGVCVKILDTLGYTFKAYNTISDCILEGM